MTATPQTPPNQLLAALQAEQQRAAKLEHRLLQLESELEVMRGAALDASTSRLLTEEALDDTRSRLALAMEAAQLGLWEWTLKTGQVFVNAQWSALMGDVMLECEYGVEQLLARIHPDDLPALSHRLQAVTEGSETRYRAAFRIRKFDNEWLWMESHGMGVDLDQTGRPARMVGVSADISERKQLQHATESARREAEAASRSKSEFLANVSHEVRTPLNGVMGLIRLMTDSPLNEQQRHWLKLMDDSSQTLLSLLNDVLDLSKIEAGRMDVERARFNLPDALEQTCAPLVAQADQKKLTVDMDIHPGLPEWVLGDPTKLRQVLTNLLSNALKFTPDGGTIRIKARPADGGKVLLEVKDSGIGIAPEQQKKVFEAFTQADASTTRKYGGTGLGLTISARLVQLMGGQLKLESTLGKGCRFFFELPLPVSHPHHQTGAGPLSAPLELEHLNRQDLPFKGLRVLVAEDHPVNELLMRELLKKLECHTTVARNGLEAIALWKQGGFDLVLMDVQMPELNGLDATTEIRALEGSGFYPPGCTQRHTPIVAVTANAMSEDAALCLSAGMDTYTSKPVSPQALTRAMAEALELAAKSTPGASDSKERRPFSNGPRINPEVTNKPAPAPLNVDKLRHRLGESGQALAHVADTAMAQLREHMEAMAGALAQQQQAEAVQHAHALKLILASLTADRAAALCNGLETAAQKGEWALFGRAFPVFQTEMNRLEAALMPLMQS